MARRIKDVGRGSARIAATLLFLASAALATPCRLEQGQSVLTAHPTAQLRQLWEACARAGTDDPATAFVLGRFSLLQGDDSASVHWLEQAARLDPSSSPYQLWLGRAYGAAALHASIVHQPALARKVQLAFAHAVALDPGNLAARQSLVEYYVRAPRLLGGSLEKARAEAEEIRRRGRLEGHRALGYIAEHEKRFDAAANEYDRAISEFPDSLDAVLWRAELAEGRKDYDAAFDRLEAYVKRDPSDSEALYKIGELAARSGERLDRGEACLRLYLDSRLPDNSPSPAAAHYLLGLIYERKKDRERARREFIAALDLDPLLTEARQALVKIR